ncbi:MAG: RHS repeat-associated core domain-containing protein [Proteobacteria bacterium]|nr:RHS repeat-associated core domain-containing protein [Pseudomonadota bacterium]
MSHRRNPTPLPQPSVVQITFFIHEELIDGYLYQYDEYGDVIFESDKEGLVTRYQYDNLDRLHQIWYPVQQGAKNRAAVKERKDLGLHNNEEADIDYLESLTDIGGIEDALITNYREVFGDWTNRTGPFLNGNFHYERIDYDILGRRAVKTNEFGSIRYAYDHQDRLLRAGNRAYDYDADGNRTREYFTDQAWSVDDTGLNLYVTENNLNNPGNGNGLGIGQLNGNDPDPHSTQQETWSEFIYRADNRMVEYTDSQGEQWEYRYDSFGRRYEKERFGSAHPEKDVWRDDQIWYVGLTHNILAEYTDIEYWNDKTIQTGLEYLIGPGGRAYGAHERYTRNGHEWSPSSWKNRRYYHYDRLGSATAISLDKPGVAGESFNYGPFGDVLDGEHRWGWDYNGNHHMGFDSVGFTGYRIDAESGLYHAPFREYDPLVASWTTSDPIKSGELWYAYCSNNPVRFIDPLGLDKCTACGQGSIDTTGLVDEGVQTKFHIWEASFVEASVSYVAAPLVGGIGELMGSALVHFKNRGTGESFEAVYSFKLTSVEGAAAMIGSTIEFGAVTAEFPASTTPNQIAESYRGEFLIRNLSLPIGLVLGISASYITSDMWEGYSLGGGIGTGGGYSEQVTDYTLIPESITPLIKPSTNCFSPEEIESIVRTYSGHR